MYLFHRGCSLLRTGALLEMFFLTEGHFDMVHRPGRLQPWRCIMQSIQPKAEPTLRASTDGFEDFQYVEWMIKTLINARVID